MLKFWLFRRYSFLSIKYGWPIEKNWSHTCPLSVWCKLRCFAFSRPENIIQPTSTIFLCWTWAELSFCVHSRNNLSEILMEWNQNKLTHECFFLLCTKWSCSMCNKELISHKIVLHWWYFAKTQLFSQIYAAVMLCTSK